jgi:acyl-coenzyme A synthetase/AMP-(fatty) acid ligase
MNAAAPIACVTRLALLAGFDGPDATFAWRRGRPITCAQFLADAAALAERLPERGHVLNVATDRYRFAVGLAAAITRGQVSLLPPSTHVGTIAQLLARFPDAYCLAETPQSDIDLPQTLIDAEGTSSRIETMPQIAIDQTVAYVFTSGSTGVPTLHRKRWGSLVSNVSSEAERLACAAHGTSHAIVATVPPQHMFGFESSLLMAWQSGNAIVAERPFYPADIVSALERLPSPRMLVTTPFHLRALVAEDGDVPTLDRVVCATAPLSEALAAEAERRFAAPVLEIYGCTETGQIASRRPTVDAHWHLLGGVVLDVIDGRATASGGHIEQPTLLADVIEPASDIATSRRFLLGGRSADLVNIAGKRTSLGHLNVQLNAIDGVLDGVFVVPADDEAIRDGVTRLAAIVVAPSLDAPRLLTALRKRIDAVFLPRPVYFVDRIPRNDTGKLTQAALQTLIAALHGREGGAGDRSSSAARR